MPIVNATIIIIDNGIAELKIGNGSNIKMPVKLLPAGLKKGEQVIIETLSPDQHESRQKDIAKALLNEILGDQSAKGQGKEKKGYQTN
jgi:hypothetical protein